MIVCYYIDMKNFVLLFLIILLASPTDAKHQYTEKVYQTHWCNARGGQMEYVIKTKNQGNGRVDCLLPNMAVEVDFANKWHQCLGQALDYAAHTKKTAACVLIIESPNDYKYVNRLRYTIQKKAPGTRTFTIRPDQINIKE